MSSLSQLRRTRPRFRATITMGATKNAREIIGAGLRIDKYGPERRAGVRESFSLGKSVAALRIYHMTISSELLLWAASPR